MPDDFWVFVEIVGLVLVVGGLGIALIHSFDAHWHRDDEEQK